MTKHIFSQFLIASALIGSAAQAQFLDAVQNSQNNTIKDIRFIGNESVSDAILNARIGFKGGDQLNPNDLRDKLSESIKQLNQTKLFQDVVVGLDYLDKGDVDVVFRLYEKPTLDSVYYEGNDNIRVEEFKDKIALYPGQVFSSDDAERQRLKLIDHYKKEGYLQADVQYDIENGRNNKKKLTYRIAEGRKVVVKNIKFVGNSNLYTEDLIGALGSKVDHWWSAGEFKEEQFESDKDSILVFAKNTGYLDAAILETRAEYLPDQSYHFYNGRVSVEGGMTSLLEMLNKDLMDPLSPMGSVAVHSEQTQNPFYRRFGSQDKVGQSSMLVPRIKTESELVDFFNRIVDNSSNRSIYLEKLGVAENRTSESESKKQVRLALEQHYPVLKMAEINTSSEVELTFVISEGKRYYASQFNFIGNAVLTDAALKSRITLDSGEVFSERKFQQMLQDIYGLYREDGYLFARIEEQKTYNDSLVSVTFNIVEGKPASIRRIGIKGNTTTVDKVVRREIKLFPGDTYRQSLMERSFRDIMQLNYFEGVVPDIKPVSEQEVDLEFNVKEREAGTGQFSAGMAYTARDGLLGTLGLSIPNFSLNPFGLGGGQRIDLNVEYGAIRQNYTLGYSEPWFRDRPIRVGGSLNYSNFQTHLRPITRKGFRAFVGSRLTWPDDYFYIQSDYNWQLNDQGANKEGLVLYTGLESSVSLTIIRDDKNLPTFPTDGSRMSLTTQYAGLGGDFNFIKNDLDAKWWFPIFSGLSMSFQGQLGVISGDAVQFQTLYQMGGLLGFQGKARGYAPGSIGQNRIGRSYLSMTSELTYPVVDQRFYMMAFFDAGNVFGVPYPAAGKFPSARDLPSSANEINPSDLMRDYGAGFRVIVPMIGIIGFDFAFPLDPAELSNGTREKFVSSDYQVNFVIEQGF